jgi:hypothetical protein
VKEAEEHLESCGSCKRYVEVFDRGCGILRSFEGAELSEDFRPRLQRRIYHIADATTMARTGNSGATAATALGMAILLVFTAWSPSLVRSEPQVQLAPIVVQRPQARTLGIRPAIRPRPVSRWSPNGDPMREGDLWARPSDLLFENSSLSTGFGSPSLWRPVDFN